VQFRLPEEKWGRTWAMLLNTADTVDHMSEESLGPTLEANAEMQVEPWSLVLLTRTVPR